MKVLRALSALAIYAAVMLVLASPVFATNAPTFQDSNGADITSLTLTVDENISDQVVAIVAAVDDDNDPLTYTLSGTDASSFIDDGFILNASSGEIKVSASATIDYETRSSYTVTLGVGDFRDAAGVAEDVLQIDDTLAVTINVRNLNEFGSLSVAGASQVGATLRATLTDRDTVKPATLTWRWSRSSSFASGFVDIAAATSATYQPTSAHVGMFLRVTANYEDGHGPGKSKFVTVAQIGTLISNVSQNVVSNSVSPSAQAFTTGGSANGYKVTAVGVHVHRDSSPDRTPYVSLYTSDGSEPDKLLVKLEPPASLTAGAVNTFSVPRTVVLKSGTTYFVEFSPDITPNCTCIVKWATADGGDVEDVGKSQGWEIAERRLTRGFDHFNWRSLHTRHIIQVEGQPRDAVSDSVPAFTNTAETLSVNENSEAGASVGAITATDTDGDALVYSVSAKSASATDMASFDAFNAAFVVSETTGQITVRKRADLDYETTATYSVKLQVTDQEDSSGYIEPAATATIDDTLTLNINVTNVDEPGSLTLDDAPETGTALTATLDDPDGSVTVSQWQWARGNAINDTFSDISGANAGTYTPIAEDSGKLLRVTATYTDGGPGGNQQVQATARLPVDTPETVLVSNIEQQDSGARSQIAAQPFTTGASTNGYALTSLAIRYVGGERPRVRIFGADTAGSAPAASAIAELVTPDEVVANTEVTFTSPTGVSLEQDRTYFVVVSGPDGDAGARFGRAVGGAEDSGGSEGWAIGDRFRSRSALTDSWGASQAPMQIQLNGYANFVVRTEPYFTRDSETYSLDENSSGGTIVGLPVTVKPDTSDTLTYSVSGADASHFSSSGVFSLNTATGQISVRSGASVDFESSSQKTSYTVTLSVTNSEDETGAAEAGAATIDDTIAVTINVKNLDEVTPGFVTLDVFGDLEAESLVLATAGTDPDGAVSNTKWQWSWSAAATGPFTDISGETSSTYTIDDDDAGTYLRATVTYDDPQGTGKTAHATTARVAGDAVVMTTEPAFADDTVTLTVAENADDGTAVGTVSATDADGDALTYSVDGDISQLPPFNEDFSLDTATGAITVKTGATLDYEVMSSYGVTLNVTDKEDGSGNVETTATNDDTVGVTINVINVDEAGVVAWSVTTPEVGVAITASLTDPDEGVTGATWQWSSSATASGPFTNITGAASASYSYTPVAGDLGKFLKAKASYSDYQGSGKSAERVAGSGVANPPPAFADADDDGAADAVTVTVGEDAAAGDSVGTALTATDPNGDTLSYSVSATSDTDGAAQLTAFKRDFELNAATGQITVKAAAAIDFETRQTYKVSYQVTDGKNASGVAETGTATIDDTLTLTVSVTDANDLGTVTIVGTPQVGVVLKASVTDPDVPVSAVTWQWLRSSTAGVSFAMISSGGTSATYKPVAGDQRKFLRARAIYTDAFGTGQIAEGDTAAQVASTRPEFATTAESRSVAEDVVAGDVWAALTATDADGDTLTYSVAATSDTDGAAHLTAFNRDFFLNPGTGQIRVRASAVIDYETRQTYKVTYRVTDGNDASGDAETGTATIDDTLTLTVSVTNANDPGTVTIAGTARVDVVLKASVTDPDVPVSAVSWQWSRSATAGGSFVNLSSGGTAASYKPVAGDLGKFLKARATYTDAFGTGQVAERVTAAVAAIVVTPTTPEFATTAESRSVAENVVSGNVGAALTATDADGDTLTYSVAATSDSDGAAHLTAFNRDFSLNATTGQLTVKTAATINYETRQSYKVSYRVTDGNDASGVAETGAATIDDTLTLTVSVTNMDEAGAVSLSETTPVVGVPITASLTDPDEGVTGAAWQWSSSATASGPFTNITGASAASYTPKAGDARKYLRASVTYSDTQGPDKRASKMMGSALGAGNTNPSFPNNTAQRSLNENTAVGENVSAAVATTDANNDSLFYSLSGTDAASFDIEESTGQVKTGTGITYNFESSKKSYTLVVEVSDRKDTDGNADTVIDDTITVTITLVNVKEEGVVTLAGEAAVGLSLTASLSDPDEGVTNTRWQWARADSATGAFTAIRGATSASYTMLTADAGKYLRATATYRDAQGGSMDQTAQATSGEVAANAPPSFSAETATRSVDENVTAVTNVGAAVTASDVNSDTLSYSLSGTDASSFTIDSSTGQITTVAGETYDFETRSSYTVTVSVSDSKDGDGAADTATDATITGTINLGNLDEPGVLEFVPSSAFHVGSAITVELTDPDGELYSTSQRALRWVWETSTDQASWRAISDFGKQNSGASLSAAPARATYAPTEDDRGKYLRVTVTGYRDGHGSGKHAQAVTGSVVGERQAAPPLTVVPLVTGLTLPMDLAFTHDGAMLFVERPGNLKVRLSDGTIQTVTADQSDLHTTGWWGILAIALDPAFATNRRFYTYQSHHDPNLAGEKRSYQIVVWTIDDTYSTATRDGEPFSRAFTAGGSLLFDPDGYLLMSRGHGSAQDLTDLGGKVLRFDTSTRQGAAGNPFPATPSIYTYGHRVPHGLALRPGTSEVWVVEHGPEWNDEINVLTAGGNYGWDPRPEPDRAWTAMTDLAKFPDAVEAKWSSGFSTIATNRGVFLNGADWGVWNGRFAVATLIGVSLRIFEFSSSGAFVSQVVPTELRETYGRLRTPVLGPDGALYLTTSNSPSNQNGGIDQILRVVPSLPPVFASPTETHEAPEDSGLGATVTTVAATDPEDRDIRYELGGRDAALFTLANDSTGEVQTDSTFDYETQRSYEVLVTAFDDYGLSDVVTLTINITDVDEASEIRLASSGRSVTSSNNNLTVAENHTGMLATFAADDPENEPSITYAWSVGGTDGDDFAIAAGGVLTFAQPPDYELPADSGTNNVYDLTVTAMDSNGLSGSITLEVTVTPVDEPPAISGSATPSVEEGGSLVVGTYTATDPEGATLAWQPLAGADSDGFTFDSSNGRLSLKTAPDFEAPTDSGANNVYEVTLGASAGTHTTTLDVALTVTNEDEDGALGFSSPQPQAESEFTATLSDPDELVSTTWTWERSADQSTWAAVTGSVDSTTTSVYTPAAGDVDHYLRATASYADRHGPNKSGMLVSSNRVREAPGPGTNHAPAFAEVTASRSVAENALANAAVGVPVTATDSDSGDTLSYTISGDLFTVDSASGQIRVKAADTLDHETAERHTVTVTASDASNATAGITVTIEVSDVNEAPEAKADSVAATEDQPVVIDVLLNDSDPDAGDTLTLLSTLPDSPDHGTAEVDATTNRITYTPNPNYVGADSFTYRVQDSNGSTSDATVAITVRAGAAPSPGTFIGGGGGGGGPSPSSVDFEWTVTRDIEALDSGNDWPTGLWSVGGTLFIAENGSGADDEVYAYDLKTGARVEEREFALDDTNRAPRGFWSDGVTAWVSDSGRDRLFAYSLESGERVEEREFELDRRNRDGRGIWSDGATMWVLDGGKDALFACDLAGGELLAEYELHSANSDPRGIWSDGVTVWVSDHGAKRLFAYRLPGAPDEPAAEDADAIPLERVRDLEFSKLSSVSNNSPRGIWSDGGVMYVADASDGRVYTYNMPDAIDARLASLTLSGVDFGEFDSSLTDYAGSISEGVTETTITAEAMQRGATLAIEPADADETAEGHQLTLVGLGGIAVTVTSADDSRTKVYRVRLGDPAPWPHCLRGAVAEGFSLVVYEGGTVEDLTACAASRNLSALYALHEGAYVSYILGAPPFVNSAFAELFAGGVPEVTALVARSDGPASEDPVPAGAVSLPGPDCLPGEVVTGFSLLVYQGGSVEELEACAQSRGVTALYALSGGTWVSYILGAPQLVNRAFGELFADGVPAVTPLVARSGRAPSGQ